MLQSLHSFFALLATGDTLTYCPQAAEFAKALSTGARTDNGHITSLASSLALALRSERSTLAVAGVFGAAQRKPCVLQRTQTLYQFRTVLTA